ncbi:MAG: metal-sulfur cluster assembly factor [Spirochaetota bacterium]
MATKGEVLDALSRVIDPEIGLNIVDIGLVYRVDVDDEHVEVDFTLTSPGCPLADTIIADIRREVTAATGIDEVQANIVWNPPWSLDFMSEDARLQLGYPI